MTYDLTPETKKVLADFEQSLKDFDKAMQDLSLTMMAIQHGVIPEVKDSIYRMTEVHPQDIADKELSEKLSEIDYINQRDEDNYREAYQEHHQK